MAVAGLALVGLLAAALFQIFDDDGGGGGNGNVAAAVATQTREAELAAMAALTPTTEPATTVEPDDEADAEATEPADAAGAEETDGAGDDAPATTADEDEAEPTEEPEEVSVDTFLPSTAVVPDGFTRDAEASRIFTEDEVAAALGNEEESAALLDEWGWREGAVRQYINNGATEDDTSVLIGSVHRFGSSSSASDALTYFSDAVAVPQDLEDIEVETIGDGIRALSGQTEAGANQVILYIRTGPYLLRVAGTSAAGDPTADVVALAEQLIDG